MVNFKRPLKGLIPMIFCQAFLLYNIFSGFIVNPIVLVLVWASCLINAVLLVRSIMTAYLSIDETKLIINRDLFVTTIIPIDEIKQVKFVSGLFPYGKIQMKNGTSVLFRDDYLDADAKAALLNLENRNA
jgi:hypothetical protein